jgi:hypothetical protein
MRIPIDLPPGLIGDDTSYAASGRWADGSNVRFRLGRPQVIGGWESLTTTLLTGVCRNAFPWTDNNAILNIAFGTHSNLQVFDDGTLYDITPTLWRPSVTLANNPLSVTNASPTVTVTENGHGHTVGESVIISGATAVGGIAPNGTFTVASVIDVNTWTYTFTSNATGTATGGGSAVVAASQTPFVQGQIDGTGGQGYGTGAYGVGGWSQPSTADYFPRTWSFGAWGQNLLANPRGGPIYAWTNNTGTPAQPLANSPRQVQHMVVAPTNGAYQAFALGCNEELSGVFNPMCVRHCSITIDTEWNTAPSTTAAEYVLPGGGRIVAGRMIGPYLAVWTSDALWIAEFIGDPSEPWQFTRVGKNCGLSGPNAVVVFGQGAYWLTPDRQFYRYGLGTSPQVIDCPIRDDFAQNISPSQTDKIIASSNTEYGEIRFDYPDVRDGSGTENSRYVALDVTGEGAGTWYKGEMARTAMVDAAPSQYPIGVTSAGNVYYHERGHSADGGQISWFVRTADLYLDENIVMEAAGIWPDFIDQQGPVNVEATSRFYLQDDEVSTGPIPMGMGQQKVDFRLSGRLFRFKFSGSSSPAQMRLGKFDVEVRKAGQR